MFNPQVKPQTMDILERKAEKKRQSMIEMKSIEKKEGEKKEKGEEEEHQEIARLRFVIYACGLLFLNFDF